MLAQQTLQGYLSYYDNVINGEQYEGKGKKVCFVKEHINGVISCLVKGKYFNFPVHAYNEVAHFIKQNFPMEYDKNNFPTRRYQVNVACHYSWAKSKTKQAYILFGVIDYIYPVTNSLVDIVNLTGKDKTTEESNDYSNIEEIDLGKSDEDWEV
jgi:hypothetical protein